MIKLKALYSQQFSTIPIPIPPYRPAPPFVNTPIRSMSSQYWPKHSHFQINHLVYSNLLLIYLLGWSTIPNPPTFHQRTHTWQLLFTWLFLWCLMVTLRTDGRKRKRLNSSLRWKKRLLSKRGKVLFLWLIVVLLILQIISILLLIIFPSLYFTPIAFLPKREVKVMTL